MSFHGLIDIFIIEDDFIVWIYHRLSVHLLKDMSVICNLGGVYIINIHVQVFYVDLPVSISVPTDTGAAW